VALHFFWRTTQRIIALRQFCQQLQQLPGFRVIEGCDNTLLSRLDRAPHRVSPILSGCIAGVWRSYPVVIIIWPDAKIIIMLGHSIT